MSLLSPSGFQSDVNNRVNQNGTRAITGLIMNSVLTNIKDSLRFKFIVADTAARNAIPTADRSKGMTVFVESSDSLFRLSDDLSTWEEILTSAQIQALVDAGVATFNARIFSPVADLAALKALDTTNASNWPDKGLILTETLGIYRLDRDSTATPTDNVVVQPTTGVGRWIKTSLSQTEITFLIALTTSGLSVEKINREYSIATKVANYSIVSTDKSILVDATAGNLNITLPDPSTVTGYTFNIKKIDTTSNTVTILPFASENIEFGSNIVLFIQGEVANLQSNGTDWFLIQ